MPDRKPRLVITEEARTDRRKIILWSKRYWRSAQAASYRAELYSRIKSLVVHSELGPTRDEVKVGLRGLLVGEPVVFYRIAENEIRVARVLHHARDAAAAFESTEES